MAIANSNVTVTKTWTQISASATGDFVFYNEAQPTESTPPPTNPASRAIRWCFAATDPTGVCRGYIVYPGCSFSRGSVEGHVWVKTDYELGDGLQIMAQKAE